MPVDSARIQRWGTNPIYFYGWATYNTVFKNTEMHVTMFNGYAGDPTSANTFVPLFGVCPGKHNCADDECDGEQYGDGKVWHAVKK